MYKLYAKLSYRYPKFRKFTRKALYQFLARLYKQRDWTFMNFGYTKLAHEEEPLPELQANDEINRTCIQLYHHLAGSVDLNDDHVLEVGSGRGGGADYIKRYLGPQRMVGVDLSERAVALANDYFDTEGLEYMEGDAESLPFDDGTFDAVVNVESSHCYGSFEQFVSEVKRVLKPGGHFLFTDFRPKELIDLMHTRLEASGLHVVKHKDITANVVNALDVDEVRRKQHIARGVPKFLENFVQEFAGTKGTTIYDRFANNEFVYRSYVLQKPAVAE